MEYLQPGKAIIKKKRHWWNKHDALLDQIDDINAVLEVTKPGTQEYADLLSQRKQIEDIRKTRKETKVIGRITSKEGVKLGASVLVTGGLYLLGTLLDVDSPKAMRHAERTQHVFERIGHKDD